MLKHFLYSDSTSLSSRYSFTMSFFRLFSILVLQASLNLCIIVAFTLRLCLLLIVHYSYSGMFSISALVFSSSLRQRSKHLERSLCLCSQIVLRDTVSLNKYPKYLLRSLAQLNRVTKLFSLSTRLLNLVTNCLKCFFFLSLSRAYSFKYTGAELRAPKKRMHNHRLYCCRAMRALVVLSFLTAHHFLRNWKLSYLLSCSVRTWCIRPTLYKMVSIFNSLRYFQSNIRFLFLLHSLTTYEQYFFLTNRQCQCLTACLFRLTDIMLCTVRLYREGSQSVALQSLWNASFFSASVLQSAKERVVLRKREAQQWEMALILQDIFL